MESFYCEIPSPLSFLFFSFFRKLSYKINYSSVKNINQLLLSHGYMYICIIEDDKRIMFSVKQVEISVITELIRSRVSKYIFFDKTSTGSHKLISEKVLEKTKRGRRNIYTIRLFSIRWTKGTEMRFKVQDTIGFSMAGL